MTTLTWIHRVFANLKLWALGAYHGLRRRQMHSYLDEFVFRFNRRQTCYAGFRSLLTIAAGHALLTYHMLISSEAKEQAFGRVSDLFEATLVRPSSAT